jgi:hypothetical protein
MLDIEQQVPESSALHVAAHGGRVRSLMRGSVPTMKPGGLCKAKHGL